MNFSEDPKDELEGNRFVEYLNSLQRAGGSNENALAESQACTPLFSYIHVVHPLVSEILTELDRPQGNHVILTGHAGDGKSTIALEVLKRLKGISSDSPLDTYPQPREDIGNISILKDLSERNRTIDFEMIEELSRNERRFLLVSNTGTLLDMVKRNSRVFSEEEVTLESQVLTAINSDSGEDLLKLGTVSFRIYNLAKMDNLSIAERIFRRMISSERWVSCLRKECHHNCAIYRNVELIQKNKGRVIERIFLVYRKMYEYGIRLTMRQLTEHMAYTITSSLSCRYKESCSESDVEIHSARHLFTNRFFGDDGCKLDQVASEMKSIKLIQSEGFGTRQAPKWEHQLWLSNHDSSGEIFLSDALFAFQALRDCGAGVLSVRGVKPDQARLQVRRMMYFLYPFNKDDEDYISHFLNSPSILSWMYWQKNELAVTERTRLDQKIFHVIQEHFSGVRLPEGSTLSESRLYITLNRRSGSIRQSSRVVLAQLDWTTSTELKLLCSNSATGEERRDLNLVGKNTLEGIKLPLKIPFLDYVMMRNLGELGETLDSSYVERLNRYKVQVFERSEKTKHDHILMIRTNADRTFSRHSLVIGDGKMEVSNDL